MFGGERGKSLISNPKHFDEGYLNKSLSYAAGERGIPVTDWAHCNISSLGIMVLFAPHIPLPLPTTIKNNKVLKSITQI
jgi:hypothetical protein